MSNSCNSAGVKSSGVIAGNPAGAVGGDPISMDPSVPPGSHPSLG